MKMTLLEIGFSRVNYFLYDEGNSDIEKGEG